MYDITLKDGGSIPCFNVRPILIHLHAADFNLRPNSIRPVISIKLLGGLDGQNLSFTILLFLRLSEYLG